MSIAVTVDPDAIVDGTDRPAISRSAPSVNTSAAASAACRPRTVAESSSRRPESSSVRVCLITISTLNTATPSAPNPVIFSTEIAPSECSS